ncbi:MAG: alpha/beta fold hydrolase [Chloroflexi bacterium]|nr:alpha/beta fold hydrolase [Chloroflexota bacterium]
MKLILVFLLVLAGGVGLVGAQDGAPVTVEITAADGAVLVGDYYAPTVETEGDPIPVLLMHQYGSNRRSWSLLVPELLAEGYAVYAVDLRGFGDSARPQDFAAAQSDTQVWIDWILQQPETADDAIYLIGASVGSNLALVGCAAHPACVTAVALSPGLDFYEVMTEPALHELRTRSALLIATQRDRESAEAVKTLTTVSEGEIGVQFFSGSAHGTSMLTTVRGGRVQALIVDWLRWQQPRSE